MVSLWFDRGNISQNLSVPKILLAVDRSTFCGSVNMSEPEFPATAIETFGNSCQYRYNKRNFIAKGSFGIVYEARITESGNYAGNEVAAVKCVQLEEARLLTNMEIRKALRSRSEKIFGLKHSHLLAYYKTSVVGTPRGFSVEFLMDYYNEGDLAAFLSSSLRENKTSFGEAAVICFALQLADGLTYLHKEGIVYVHGDIKPGNILVKSTKTKHRKLVIGDLDDCFQMQPDTSVLDMTLFHGTVRYMSPEMLRTCLTEATNENIGCKTDVWSLGCVILDLANHSVGIRDKCLCKETSVQAVDNLADYRFAGLISEGWVPFVAESIPVSVAACIHECLRPDYTCRISAEKLLEKLRDTAKDLSKLSRATELVDQDCFCSYG